MSDSICSKWLNMLLSTACMHDHCYEAQYLEANGGTLWSWSYGSWVNLNICNWWLSPLKLIWVWCSACLGILDTCD